LSERVEPFADPSEVSAEAEPGESVRPFSHPKDAPGLFWVRLRVDYPRWGPVHIFPTSTLNAKAWQSDYVITLHDDHGTTLSLSAGPPSQADMTLQEHGLHPEDRQRHYWVQSPPLQPWSAKQLIALLGALHGFTRVDPHFWTRLRGEEVEEEEEPIKAVSESKVVVDGPITKREIAWRPERFAKDDYEVVWLDIAKFDELWRGEIGFYIERDPDAEKGIDNRYLNVGNWIMAGNDVDLPSVSGDDYFASTELAGFVDGRHRFAWVRDHGAKAIPVIMDKDKCAEIKRRCGTDERICQVTYNTQEEAEAVKVMKWQEKREKVHDFFRTAAMLRDQIDETAGGGDVFPLARPAPEACRAAVTAIESMVEALNNIGPLREGAALFRRPSDRVERALRRDNWL